MSSSVSIRLQMVMAEWEDSGSLLFCRNGIQSLLGCRLKRWFIAYYRVFRLADNAGESTLFVEFMLRMIRDALQNLSTMQSHRQQPRVKNVGTNVGANEEKLLLLLKQDGTLTAKVLAGTLDITQRQVERMIAKLKVEGILVRHGATKNGFWEVVKKHPRCTMDTTV